jgi:hypothetical protein
MVDAEPDTTMGFQTWIIEGSTFFDNHIKLRGISRQHIVQDFPSAEL